MGNQSGRGIPAFAATYLQGQLAVSRILLFPHTTPSIKAARTIAHRGQLAPLAIGAHAGR
jgi:hypothetical protein